MKKSRLALALTGVLAAAVLVAAPAPASGAPSAMTWQTGMRAVGNGATIEPAVNDTNGMQTFLITPNGAPFYDGSADPTAPLPPSFARVSAPLYLVTYPLASTADSAVPFNCYTEGFFSPGDPYNCDHAQIPGIKGHDHLVGVPGSQKAGGDYNVQWHVLATFFTPKGVTDGAMNTRITTLAQLMAAQQAKDVSPFVDTHIYFYCSAVSGAVYAGATPMTFAP